MTPVYLAILWHHHQPAYSPVGSPVAALPWVRLHAIKDYAGMALLAREHPALRHTVNLVPALLDQIEAYAEGRLTDADEELLRMPAADLAEPQAVGLLDRSFRANVRTMVRPHARYRDLWTKRRAGACEARQVLGDFATQDLRDLQVWATLAWFHPLVLAQREDLRNLVAKGEGFTEDDKHAMLTAQREVVASVVPLHRELADAGTIELTTSPHYHPVVPLLCDARFALRATDPDHAPSQCPDGLPDARAQLACAVAAHAERFGRAPAGLWPPEGAVGPTTLRLAADAGLRWAASDEGVLARSLGLEAHERVPRERLYGVWEADPGGGWSLPIVFRDRTLSDLVSFHYPRAMAPEAAARDLLGRVRAAPCRPDGAPPLVTLIMDGENAWEFYPDQGLGFLSTLYRLACEDEVVRPVTVTDYLERFGATERLAHVHCGSWIRAGFDMWIGEPKQNAAWELLARTRRAVMEGLPALPPDRAHSARDALFRAEGSDWFWWYARRNRSVDGPAFDELFRAHLRRACELAGATPPAGLDEPIAAPAGQGR